jgi:long-subunit acyl-CoA synthetase (AMP-forming)
MPKTLNVEILNAELDFPIYEKDAIVANSATSLPAVMKKTSEKFKNHTALMYKNEAGEWKGINYEEYYKKVEKIAKIFIKLGLQKNGVVAVLASNSVEWLISELAVIHAG